MTNTLLCGPHPELSDWTFTTIPWGKCYRYPHCIAEGSEVRGAKTKYPQFTWISRGRVHTVGLLAPESVFLMTLLSKSYKHTQRCWTSQVALVIKNPPANAGDIRDAGSIRGSGKFPGGGHGNALQCSCLENPHGQRSLAGYSPWGPKESGKTEHTCTCYIACKMELLKTWKSGVCS